MFILKIGGIVAILIVVAIVVFALKVLYDPNTYR
jgi:hypothetical protein